MEYDGSLFHGWQEQSGLRTAQGTLQEALAAVLGHEVTVAGTSRTDAGVHALGQCCSFRTGSAIPVEKIPLAVNHMLAGGRTGAGSKVADLRVTSATEVPQDFHARFDCRGKTYRYVIRTGEPDIFLRNYVYYIEGEPDIALMREAAGHLIGTHDFRCFMAAGGTPGKTTVRTVTDLTLEERKPGSGGREIVMEITGDGFLYNMVRIIAGTLIEAGLGRIRPDEMPEILGSLDRGKAGHTAPPWGLYLKEIYFDSIVSE